MYAISVLAMDLLRSEVFLPSQLPPYLPRLWRGGPATYEKRPAKGLAERGSSLGGG